MKLTKIIPLLTVVMIAFSCQPKTQQATGEHSSPAAQSPFTNLSVAEFDKMMHEDVVVLDVRTPQETAMGKIDGAIEIDVTDPSFAQKTSQLDKDKTYLVYCRSGRRSVSACTAMAEQGFGHLYNLVGGYTAWSAEKH